VGVIIVLANISDLLRVAGAVTAALVALGVLSWLVQIVLAVWQERKRSQPIVLVHEDRERHFERIAGSSAWVVDAHIENVGAGPAFNVRFGVEFNGVRFPYRLTVEDPESGNRQSVLKPGDRIPPEGALPILITSEQMWGSAMKSTGEEGELDRGRVYWARFENSSGRLWETRNPGDRSADLDIHPLRKIKLRWRARREVRHRAEVLKLTANAEAELLADLEERRKAGQ
jgi:hypothetical protein